MGNGDIESKSVVSGILEHNLGGGILYLPLQDLKGKSDLGKANTLFVEMPFPSNPNQHLEELQEITNAAHRQGTRVIAAFISKDELQEYSHWGPIPSDGVFDKSDPESLQALLSPASK